MKCKCCKKKQAVKYSKYSTGEFCSRECARRYSTLAKRDEINKKVSKTLTGTGHGKVINTCVHCKSKFEIEWRRRNQKYCSQTCANSHPLSEATKKKISNSRKKQCEKLEERKRLRDIGRKGGFGKKGYTKGGIRYESTLEKKCYEWLEKREVQFEPHKPIPESSKVSDVYFEKEDIWVELDGIDREKRQKWLEEEYKYWRAKIDLYESLDLKYEVIKSFDEFKVWYHKNIGA